MERARGLYFQEIIENRKKNSIIIEKVPINVEKSHI